MQGSLRSGSQEIIEGLKGEGEGVSQIVSREDGVSQIEEEKRQKFLQKIEDAQNAYENWRSLAGVDSIAIDIGGEDAFDLTKGVQVQTDATRIA